MLELNNIQDKLKFKKKKKKKRTEQYVSANREERGRDTDKYTLCINYFEDTQNTVNIVNNLYCVIFLLPFILLSLLKLLSLL